MKKMIQKNLLVIIVISMLVSLVLNYGVQVMRVQQDMRATSSHLFWQIEQILSQNQVETQAVVEEFKNTCLIQAKAAAYIVQHRPSVLEDKAELEKIAALLQIDELHVFDQKGNLYAGTEPQYFGYTFDSGEQMRFFLPMLQDKSLGLCQDVMPNTAESKLMQYAAVWREDGVGIVQIGMEPERVLEATKKNELSYIFSLLTAESGATLYAVDPQTYVVLGSTDHNLVGKHISEIGLDAEEISNGEKGFYDKIGGRFVYGVFELSGEPSDTVLLGRICTIDSLFRNITMDSILLGIYLCLLAILIIINISRYLDRIIVSGIAVINEKLQKITDGDLDERVDVQTTPEFTELSGHINQMVHRLLQTTDKLSSVLDIAQIPIGVYEYNKGMERVRITNRVPDILGLSEAEKDKLVSNYIWFEERLQYLRQFPFDKEQSVYQLPGLPVRYIRLESFQKDNNILGILMDVTKDVQERQLIEQERDEDSLTGLCNRRAFYAQMEELFACPEQLKHSAMLMIDADNLKQVNDNYGHEDGDRYLCSVADVLRTVTAEHQIITRLGGDEFAMFLYGCDERQQLEELIDRLKEKQNGYILSPEQERPVYFSIGCAFYPEDGNDYHALLKWADIKMYEEKRRKK